MRRFVYGFLSFAAIGLLSLLYGLLLRWFISWNPANFLAWLFFTLIEGGFILSIAGAYYFFPSQKPEPPVPFETFKANFESPEPITEEMEAVPVWQRSQK